VLHVENMRGSDAAQWDGWLRQSPGGGHALQTYAWGEVKRTQGWTPVRVALKDGTRVAGVAQMLVRDAPGVTGALAYCPKGPWIDWSQADHARIMLGGMEHFARRRGAFILKVESEALSGPGQPRRVPPSVEEPLGHLIAAARRPCPGSGARHESAALTTQEEDTRVAAARAAILAARATPAASAQHPGRAVFTERGYVKARWDPQFRTTMVVDLDRSPTEMLARMKSKWRYNIALAQRKGVTVVADNRPAARRTLYEMHRRTAQRDGFVPRRKAYVDAAWDTMIDAGHAHIFFAYHHGRPLAGLLAYTFGQKVWYQVGASETEGRHVMPAHLLQFHVMHWAWERGMTYYDLVAIPNAETISARDSLWGLYVFKAGFGGRPVEWAGCLDKVLDPRGHAWEALEPVYYRLYKWCVKDALY